MPVQRLHVRGLLHSDEARVEQTLRAMVGVIYAAASHVDECAEVEFEDDTVTTDALRNALKEIGYDARMAG